MRFEDEQEQDDTPTAELLSHREIAAQLGIGRARVFFHEHDALKKIRKALLDQGIASRGDFESVPRLREPPTSLKAKTHILPRFSPLHGWLRAGRIVSLNDGCTE